jgi:ABC-2 type transport system permease protein
VSPSRVGAILRQELYITRGSVEVMVDLPLFSVMSVTLFGFVTAFLSGLLEPRLAHDLFLGAILWEVVRVAQYSMAMEALWNVWSRNLSNMFIAPLTLAEYVLAQMISSALKAALILLLVSLLALAFGFNLYQLGLAELALIVLNLVVFAWSLGLLVLGLICVLGTRIQALAWGLVFLFQPLSAALYPVAVLPPPLQAVARAVPASYVFEAARAGLDGAGAAVWPALLAALAGNAAWFAAAWLAFRLLFRRSQRSGQFARNEQ